MTALAPARSFLLTVIRMPIISNRSSATTCAMIASSSHASRSPSDQGGLDDALAGMAQDRLRVRIRQRQHLVALAESTATFPGTQERRVLPRGFRPGSPSAA